MARYSPDKDPLSKGCLAFLQQQLQKSPRKKSQRTMTFSLAHATKFLSNPMMMMMINPFFLRSKKDGRSRTHSRFLCHSSAKNDCYDPRAIESDAVLGFCRLIYLRLKVKRCKKQLSFVIFCGSSYENRILTPQGQMKMSERGIFCFN